MPTLIEHGEHSQHNIDFLASFLLKHSNDWAVTVMFYIAVHVMEAVLGKENIHCQNHQTRKNELEKLDVDGLKDALRLYRNLERKAHDSRYTNYKVFDWEVHRVYRDLLRKIIVWFNNQKFESSLNMGSCDKMDDCWYEKYLAKDPECNRCH